MSAPLDHPSPHPDARPGPADGPRRRRLARSIAALLAAAVLGAGLVTAAHAGSGPFPDVADDHPFSYEILWLNGSGITEGYADGTFRPDQPVTRMAMAAYLSRMAAMSPTFEGRENLSGGIYSGTTWQTIPSMTTTVLVPDGPNVVADLVAEFSAETTCHGTVGFCSARILVDGQEMAPAVGADFAMDSSDDDTESASSWEGHTVRRHAYSLAPGAHEVTVQVRTGNANLQFRVDDLTLGVQVFPRVVIN